jgi:uncharacterized membrane protein
MTGCMLVMDIVDISKCIVRILLLFHFFISYVELYTVQYFKTRRFFHRFKTISCHEGQMYMSYCLGSQ